MESWEADLDNTRLREAEEFGDTYAEEQPSNECDKCGKFFRKDEILSCPGCGESYSCENCMMWDGNHMMFFCDEDCRREYERKQRHGRPGFEGVFNE